MFPSFKDLSWGSTKESDHSSIRLCLDRGTFWGGADAVRSLGPLYLFQFGMFHFYLLIGRVDNQMYWKFYFFPLVGESVPLEGLSFRTEIPHKIPFKKKHYVTKITF